MATKHRLGEEMSPAPARLVGKYPPGPRSWFPLESVFRFRRDPIAFMEENAKQYGDLVCFRLGHRRAYQLNHPDLVRDLLITDAAAHERGPVMQRARIVLGEGLLTSEEPLHSCQRRMIQPAFHRQRILEYGQSMLDCLHFTSGDWKDGAVIDLHEEMLRLTLAIVGKALFGTDFEGDQKEITESVNEFMSVIGLVFVPFSNFVTRLPLPSMVRFRRAQSRFDKIVLAMIERRIGKRESSPDLLSMLLEAYGAGREASAARQVRDQCATLILAGHETIGNALTHTLLLLARHPAVADKVRGEVEEIAGGRPIVPEQCEKLVFTRAVLAESMRLYPPVWILARTAKLPCSVRGYPVKKGSVLFASQYVLQRDPRFYDNPLKFQPDRFMNPVHPRFAYFPFGAGPRQCIGESFAWMEGVLALATLLRAWHFQPLVEGEIPLEPAITLRPAAPVPVRLVSIESHIERNDDRVLSATTKEAGR